MSPVLRHPEDFECDYLLEFGKHQTVIVRCFFLVSPASSAENPKRRGFAHKRNRFKV